MTAVAPYVPVGIQLSITVPMQELHDLANQFDLYEVATTGYPECRDPLYDRIMPAAIKTIRRAMKDQKDAPQVKVLASPGGWRVVMLFAVQGQLYSLSQRISTVIQHWEEQAERGDLDEEPDAFDEAA